MSKFLSQPYAGMEAYTPGEQPKDMQYIKLNTNESPYPPAPSVVSAVTAGDIEKLRLYSDPTAMGLKRKLAALYGVEPENIFVSNGSDEILNFAFMGYGKRGVCFPEISYGFYSVFAQLHGCPAEQIPLEEDFSIDPEKYWGKTGLVVIANPNAPTGMTVPVSAMEQVAQNNPNSVVLVDEAYVDFGGESCCPLTRRYENVLVCRTFSKSRCLAGGRLGYAIGPKALIADLEKIKYSTNPYNVNSLTLLLGEATVDAEDYYQACCKSVMETRTWTVQALESMGFRVLPSAANFVFAEKPGVDGQWLYQQLREQGILVRHFTKERIRNFNRITIGTREQMERFVTTVQDILGGTT